MYENVWFGGLEFFNLGFKCGFSEAVNQSVFVHAPSVPLGTLPTVMAAACDLLFYPQKSPEKSPFPGSPTDDVLDNAPVQVNLLVLPPVSYETSGRSSLSPHLLMGKIAAQTPWRLWEGFPGLVLDQHLSWAPRAPAPAPALADHTVG